MSRRLIFINRFYRPDLSATSQMLTDLAESLVDDFDVNVVATAKLYQDPTVRLSRHEELYGVTVHRLKTTRLGRARLWRRAIDYASFYISSLWWLLCHVRKGDLVILMTDPPLMPLLATGIIRMKRGRVANWLQDIYPEIAERLGAFPGPAWLARMVMSWRDRSLRKAELNVAIGAAMREYLEKRDIPNITVIPNWTDDQSVQPLSHGDNPLRKQWHLQDKFAVVYSGNFGRVHRFEALVDAAELLQNESKIRFLMIGEGAALEDIDRDVEARGLRNIHFEPYQARDQLRYSLGVADVHLVSLHPAMEGLVFPSKLYGVLAAGRPVIFIGDEDGEISRLVREDNIGLVVPPEDGAVLAEAIRRLANSPEHCTMMGARGRAVCDRHYSRSRSLQRWADALDRAWNGKQRD